jgi:UDP-N-acetylmuramoyl-L-alanyl-D-glutamate--2,6-diaminopimelate ligase
MVEISSRELSQAVLAGVKLDAACLTHVGRDHLDWHASLENYRQAKRRIFEHLDATGVVILNADDPVSVRMLCDVAQPALTFGIERPAEITAEIIERHVNEQTFVLTAGDESIGVRTAIIGDHHVYNCMTAAATCLVYGMELATIARGIESLERLPGRMERVVCGQEFAVLVDAAASPDTLRAALRAARQVTRGRLICVFGPPPENEHARHPAPGRVAGAMADLVVATGCPGPQDGHRAAPNHGLDEPGKVMAIPNRLEAIAYALEQARAGDTVLIAGLGDRPYGSIDCEGRPLDDRSLAEQLLRGKAVPRKMFGAAA